MEVSTQSIEMEKQSIENRLIGTLILDLPNMGFTFAYEPPLLIFEKMFGGALCSKVPSILGA